ncbi:MAG: adenylate/guanylate cyclase domain-containing protein [Vicinamibacterales bacterium]
MDPKRRLSAVWFADMVGYTTLSRTDEPAALKLVELLQDLAKEIVAAHDGRVVKFIGDAVLAEFSSTDAAVRAAVAVQERYVAAAKERGQDSRLRVGVHLGEVAATADGDLYGDGINTAARLHQQATPGQVVISEDVWRQLRQRPEFSFAALGAVELKGITTRVEIYTVLFGSRAALSSAPAKTRSRAIAAAAIATGLIVVAMLGFIAMNRGGAPSAPPPAAADSARGASTTPPPAVSPPQRQATTPALTQPAPKAADVPATKPAGVPAAERGAPPAARTAGASRPPRTPENMREVAGIRALLERLAEAVGSDNPRERIAALGPGAVPMSLHGVQQMRDAFGDGLMARVGRIEPIATRDDAVEIRFFLLVSSNTRQQTPLSFTAAVSRGGDFTFIELRREFQPGRGRGGGGG